MALETLSSSELLNFIIYDTLSATPFSCNDSSEASLLMDNISLKPQQLLSGGGDGDGGGGGGLENNSSCSMPMLRRPNPSCLAPESSQRGGGGDGGGGLAVQGGRKKRRRRPKVCKNKEEAETQRMTHIAVERNRRKQMNVHLAVLRSLMPQSYVQRGDQASIVGGAIEYVKELEHMLQSLEAEKFLLKQNGATNDTTTTTTGNAAGTAKYLSTPFAEFFTYPQYTCSQFPRKFTSKSKAAIADIEVTLIETHANVRILSRRRVRQLSKMVAAFQTLYLTILHLNVTTLDPLVLYSISAKVEEGCQFNSADDIAGAVHHILRIIEEEATLCGRA